MDGESGWVVGIVVRGQGKGGQLRELSGLTDCCSNSFRGSELERQEVMGTQ